MRQKGRLTVLYSAATDVGDRLVNQDDLLVLNGSGILARGADAAGRIVLQEQQALVAAVSDGVTRSRDGAKASRWALDALEKEAGKLDAGKGDSLPEWMNAVNERVVEQFHRDEKEGAIGAATLSMIYLHPKGGIAANIGDSPIYRLRGKRLTLLSEKHTAANEKRRLGLEQISQSDEHRLIRFVGNPYASGAEQLFYTHLEVLPGDIYLICSDGVTDVLEEDAIIRLLTQKKEAASRLVQQAKRENCDNLTTVVLAVPSRGWWGIFQAVCSLLIKKCAKKRPHKDNRKSQWFVDARNNQRRNSYEKRTNTTAPAYKDRYL